MHQNLFSPNPFLLAQQAYQEERYQDALRLYLQCQDTHHFQFYCFRAAAQLCLKLGRQEHAIEFAIRGLVIKPQDPDLQLIAHQKEQLPERSIGLGQEEFEELNKIFQSI